MDNKKGKLKDFLSASKDAAVEEATSSVLPAVVQSVSEKVVGSATAAIISGIAGSVAPGVYSALLGYRENRFERHVGEAIRELVERTDEIEERMNSLQEEVKGKFSGYYMEWFLDCLQDEKEDSKVPGYVNGFIHFMQNETSDQMMLMFFQTLSELTTLDLDTLKLYSYDEEETIFDIEERYHLKYNQVNVVKEKLSRFGLINDQTRIEERKSLNNTIQYLKDVEKNSARTKPRKISISNSKMKEISDKTKYRITGLGRAYLQIINMNQ